MTMKVLYNAQIRTFDPLLPIANTIAIENGSIIAVGEPDLIFALASPGCEKLDMAGMHVLPGFTDAHIHLLQYAQSRQKLDCEVSTKAECLARVKAAADKTQPGKWILGHGWNQNNWGDEYGTRNDLDAISRNHPIYLTAKSLHAAWVNSPAYNLAGISDTTNDPAGGYFQRDANGKLTGIMFDTAIPLIEKVIPKPTTEEAADLILRFQGELLALGITQIHDFDNFICYHALEALHRSGKLTLRVKKSFPLEHLESSIDLGLRTDSGDCFLHMGALKLFADGALGSRTAALFDPYEHETENRGLIVKDPDELAELGCMAVHNGIAVAIHAIGDRGNDVSLKAMQKIRAYEINNHLPHLRHRIEHAQLIQANQLKTFHDLNLIASMQPLHATSDQFMAEENWGSRTDHAYAWRKFVESNIPLVFGSDAPVESPNPFWGIYAAITRKRHGSENSPFHPELSITLDQALKSYVSTPLQVNGLHNRSGKIASGYFADLLVFRKDLLNLDAESLYNIKPARVMVNGNWVQGA